MEGIWKGMERRLLGKERGCVCLKIIAFYLTVVYISEALLAS